MEAKLTKIKREEGDLIRFEWDDGLTAVVTIEAFRDNCPCAQCQSATKYASKLQKFVEQSLVAEKYNLQKIEPIGNYAIKPVWGDGHEAGIYRWEDVRKICEENALSLKKIKEQKAKKNEDNKDKK